MSDKIHVSEGVDTGKAVEYGVTRPLQLEVGKYYKSREGKKVFINKKFSGNLFAFWSEHRSYDSNGVWCYDPDYDGMRDLIEEWKDEGKQRATADIKPWEDNIKIKSDGGSTSYYELPTDAKELQDLIESKNMSFARGEAFKALFRLGEKDGTDPLYDVNKILYFAERMKARILRGEKP